MTEPQTALAYRLIADFELGPTGERQGLTPAEFRRAWAARHRGTPSRRACARLAEDLLVEQLPRRECAVTGCWMHPYATRRNRLSMRSIQESNHHA